MSFAKTLNRLVADRGFSVSELSLKSGVPAKTIYHWLSGQPPRKIEHVFRLCELFDVSVEEIYGRPRRKTESELPSSITERDLQAGLYEVILRPITKGALHRK